MTSEHEPHQPPARAADGRGRARWVFIGFLVLAAFFLVTEHRAHLLGVLPWLILLACPLMHLFMHGGHGGHGGGQHHDGGNRGKGRNTTPGETE